MERPQGVFSSVCAVCVFKNLTASVCLSLCLCLYVYVYVYVCVCVCVCVCVRYTVTRVLYLQLR